MAVEIVKVLLHKAISATCNAVLMTTLQDKLQNTFYVLVMETAKNCVIDL